MKLNADDLRDSADAIDATESLKGEAGVIVHRAEVELRSGLRVTIAYDSKPDEFSLIEVEGA